MLSHDQNWPVVITFFEKCSYYMNMRFFNLVNLFLDKTMVAVRGIYIKSLCEEYQFL